MARFVFLGVFCTAALPGGLAHAYVLGKAESGATLHWPDDVVPYGIAEAGSTTLPVDEKPGEAAAIRRAFQTWEAVAGSRLRFDYYGRITNERVPDGSDGVSGVGFFSSRRLPAALGEAIAVTSVSYLNSTGEILDADILVNERDFNFSLRYSRFTTDLESVVLHEVGHLVGLDHSCGAFGEVDPSCYDPALQRDPARQALIIGAVMYPLRGVGDPSLRALSADDAAGIAALYPASPPIPAPRPLQVTPASLRGSAVAQVAVGGSDFAPGATVSISRDRVEAREAGIVSVTPALVTASVDVGSFEAGCYDVTVQNPSGKSGTAFAVLALGGGVCVQPAAASGCAAAGTSTAQSPLASLMASLATLALCLLLATALVRRKRTSR